MSIVYKLLNQPLTCHAFNADGSKLAIAANSNNVVIYGMPTQSRAQNGKCVIEDTLSEHSQMVTGVDWAAKSNLIVTCGADRNAYVWSNDNVDKKWKPTLVVLQTNRAALCVSWSPNENKFAVGCGSKSVAVCYFEEENNWWIARHIKKPIRSTITSVAWHANNNLLGCSSTDFKVRVYAAALKDAKDGKPGKTDWSPTPDTKLTFGTLLFEASSDGGGWVHAVAFSKSGNRLAWLGHDSTISVAIPKVGGGEPTVITNRHSYLPFITACWLADDENVLVAGHDCVGMIYHCDVNNHTIKSLGCLDSAGIDNCYNGGAVGLGGGKDGGEAGGNGEPSQRTLKHDAFRKFQDIDRLRINNTNDPLTSVSKLNSIHQNTINEIKYIPHCQMVSTIGRDGVLILWKVDDLSSRMKGLRI